MRTITIRYEDFEDVPSVYEYQYPAERELLDIFPEAKGIIPLKTQDWLRAKGKLLAKETIPYFKKCNALKDEFARAFWKECYAYFAGGFNHIIKQLKRLRKLEALLNCSGDGNNFEEKIEAAKQRPIVELHGFNRLRKIRNRYIALCPIHNDKSPSFYIYESNSWYCFGCNKGGDSIDFIQTLHKLNFRDAVNYLVGGVK